MKDKRIVHNEQKVKYAQICYFCNRCLVSFRQLITLQLAACHKYSMQQVRRIIALNLFVVIVTQKLDTISRQFNRRLGSPISACHRLYSVQMTFIVHNRDVSRIFFLFLAGSAVWDAEWRSGRNVTSSVDYRMLSPLEEARKQFSPDSSGASGWRLTRK